MKTKIAMKRFFISVLCITLVFLLCACSLNFSEQADDGCFSYAYGKKSAFVTEYRWNGTEEGMTVVIPESYNDLPVVSVGGFFGRGLPMPFVLNISDCFENVQWTDADEIKSIDETVNLNFILIIPEGIDEDDVKLAEWEWSQYAVAPDGKTTEYKMSIDLGREEGLEKDFAFVNYLINY